MSKSKPPYSPQFRQQMIDSNSISKLHYSWMADALRFDTEKILSKKFFAVTLLLASIAD